MSAIEEVQIWINPERLCEAQEKGTEEVKGLDLVVSVSPYDLPKTINGKYVEKKHDFDITFKYIDDEPTLTVPGGGVDGITIDVGKYSRKILRISIPIDHGHHADAAVIQLRTFVLDKKTAILNKIDCTKTGPNNAGELNHRVARFLVDKELENLVPATT